MSLPNVFPLLLLPFTLLALPTWQVKVTFSTNVSVIQVNQPFLARCTVSEYNLDTDRFDIDFHASEKNADKSVTSIIGYYQSEMNALNGLRRTTYIRLHENPALYLSSPLSSTFPTYEVAIVPKTLHEYAYYCDFVLYKGSNRIAYSNNITLSVLSQLPSLTFSTNVSQVKSGLPFTVTCTISNFESQKTNYTVQFMRTSGLLGTFDVFVPHSTGQAAHVLFVGTVLPDITVRNGKRFAYPTFEVDLQTSNEVAQDYWCSLSFNKAELKSNIWPSPTITFSSSVSTHTDRSPFSVQCSIANFSTTAKSYSVAFFANQFGLLATYAIRPNQPDNLIIQSLPAEITVSPGVAIEYPLYSLTINMTGSSQLFWCVLDVGDKSNNWQFKSNQLQL